MSVADAPTLSTGNLVAPQQEDPDIKQTLIWNEDGCKLPLKEERDKASLKSLLKQWNKLVVKQEMLQKNGSQGDVLKDQKSYESLTIVQLKVILETQEPCTRLAEGFGGQKWKRKYGNIVVNARAVQLENHRSSKDEHR